MSLQLLFVCFLASQALPQTTAHRCREFKSLIRPLEGQRPEDRSYTDASKRRRREFRELVVRREGGPSQELALSMDQLYTLVKETPTELETRYNEIPLVDEYVSRKVDKERKNFNGYLYDRSYDFYRLVLHQVQVLRYSGASYMYVETPGPKPLRLIYIAAECPLHGNNATDTRGEFWSMLMRSRRRLVVMMDSPDEVECQGHLPQSKDQPLVLKYRGMNIKLVKTQQEATYYLHEITITGRDEEGYIKTETVNYLQRRFRTPSFELFNTFLHEVRQLRDEMIQKDSSTPLILLCKDGVGWTGMFILADVALYRIDVEQAVYPLALIKELRDQRPYFIKEFEQFKWILEFILHYYNSKHPGLLDSLN